MRVPLRVLVNEKGESTAYDNKKHQLTLFKEARPVTLAPLQLTLKVKYKTTKKILQYIKDIRKQMYYKRINVSSNHTNVNDSKLTIVTW